MEEDFKKQNHQVIVRLIGLYMFVVIMCIALTVILVVFHQFMFSNTSADVIVYNAIIFGDALEPATAIAIKDGEIVEIGETADIIAHYGNAKLKVDGRNNLTVLPSFTDSHAHLLLGGRIMNGPRLTEVEDIKKVLQDYAKGMNENTWIFGGGWNAISCCYGSYPNKTMVDVVKQPVFLYHCDYHSALVNSRAFELAKINKNTTNPYIDKDANGELNGIVRESAMLLFLPLIKHNDTEIMNNVDELYLSNGITHVHDMGTLDGNNKYEILKKSKLVIYPSHPINVNFFDRERVKAMYDNGDFSFFKGFMDGTIETYTAKLLDNYEGKNFSGSTVYSEELLYLYCKYVDGLDADLAIHAIGDGAIRSTLNVFERIFKEKAKDRRWRIEHLELINHSDIARIFSLDVTTSMQPDHLTGSVPYLDKYIGYTRRQSTFLTRSLSNHILLGSDFPIVYPSVLRAIQQAILRVDETNKVHLENEYLTVKEAVAGFTVNPVRAIRGENYGELKVGYEGNIVLIEGNLFTIKRTKIADMRVLMTFLKGKLLFKNTFVK